MIKRELNLSFILLVIWGASLLTQLINRDIWSLHLFLTISGISVVYFIIRKLTKKY